MADFELPEGFVVDTPEPTEAKFDLPPGFELDVTEPVIEEPIVDTPITIDTTVPEDIIEQPVTGVISRDVTATEPTTLAIGMDNRQVSEPTTLAIGMDNRQVSEQELDLETERRKEEALIVQADRPFDAGYIDPRSGEKIKLAPAEPGMEATLAVLDIVGGIQAKAVKGIGTVYDEVTEELIKRGGTTKSKAIGYMEDLDQGRLTAQEFSDKLKDIPTEEQAIILAEGNKLYQKYFKGAIDKGDIDAARLGARLEQRKNVIDQYTANDKQMAEASKQFGDMRRTLSEQNPTSFTTSGIQNNIKALETIYKTDPTPLGTTMRNLTLDIGDEMSIDTALDLRENINAMLRKPKVSNTAKGNLSTIKNSLDSFIDVSLKDRPDLIQLKDEAIFNYRQVINDYQLGELVKKNTKNDFAVNWEKLRADVKKNKLSSENLDYAKPILKDFEKRFVNDPKLAELIVPSGAGEQNLLSMISKVYSGIIDVGHNILRTDRAHGLVIQKELKKSINNPANKHYNDFIESLMDNPKIPQEAKDRVKPIIEEIKLIEYKPLDTK